jgi:hypothetical protein
LPRLARRLHAQLKRYRAGKLDDDQFTQRFEDLLQSQYSWLADRGVPELEAAVALHAAVLVLSGPGLAAEAEEKNQAREVLEARAVSTAAADIAQNYEMDERKAYSLIAGLVARYSD